MRKWMRERLKRRKKSQDEAAPPETKKAPLQPAYFEEAAPGQKQSPAEDQTADSLPGKQAEAEQVEAEAVESAPPLSMPEQRPRASSGPGRQPSAADSGRRRRRRRGRGGRGRTAGRPAGDRTVQPLQTAAQTPEADTQAAPELLPVAPESAPTPRAPATSPGRPSKGVVVLAIGLPGSGKSSWFKRHKITPLSSDLLRGLLFDDPQEQRFQDLVFSNLRSMLKARLIARRPMNYVDATNLSPHERHSWIKLARDFAYDVHAVFFDVPLEVCLERNQRRKRVVAEDVMRRMAGKLRAPTFEEGFSKITMVRVKKKDSD